MDQNKENKRSILRQQYQIKEEYSHKINLKIQRNNNTNNKFILDINKIQHQLHEYCQERKLGDLGIFENPEYLEITILKIYVNKEQLKDVNNCIQRCMKAFANNLNYSGGFILNFAKLSFDDISKNLYFKPNLGNYYLTLLQSMLHQELHAYSISKDLTIKLIIVKNLNLNSENIMPLLSFYEQISSVAFTAFCFEFKKKEMKVTDYLDFYDTVFQLYGSLPE